MTTFSVHSKKNEEGRLETNDPLYLGTVDILITDEHPTTAVVPFFSAHIDIQVSCLYFETIYGTEVTPLVQIENSGSRYLSNQEGIPVCHLQTMLEYFLVDIPLTGFSLILHSYEDGKWK